MTTPASLLDWLSQSLFLRPDQADSLRVQLASFPDNHALCKELVRRDWLTPFQVNQILQGKADTLVVGNNRLLLRLGEGSMGQVFKAWNVRLGKVVAVKMIHKEHIASTKAMERFRREMQTAAQLDHPNIVLVRDADHVGTQPYLVMDFIDGPDLSRRIKKEGPLPVTQAVDYIRQTAFGLQHAYERGVVHRDIKPGNLLVSRNDGANVTVVKILDFGLARFASEEEAGKRLTQIGNILGTIDYISPEQAQDAHCADIRSDIYSLGCTLYFLLSGKPPFEGGSMVEKITNRIMQPPPRIRELRPEVPKGLEEIIIKIMAKEPGERFATPAEVANVLTPYLREQAPDAITPLTASAKPAQAVRVPVAAQPGAPLMAMPVQATSAQPVLAAAMVPGSPDDPPGDETFSQGFTTGNGFSDSEPTAPGNYRQSSKEPPDGGKKKRNLLILAGASAFLLLGLIVAIILIRSLVSPETKKTLPPDAFKIMPPEPRVMKVGDRRSVIVTISRKSYDGPIKIRFADLPKDLQSSEVILDAKKLQKEIWITAPYGLEPMQEQLRLVAEAEGLQISTTVDFTLKK